MLPRLLPYAAALISSTALSVGATAEWVSRKNFLEPTLRSSSPLVRRAFLRTSSAGFIQNAVCLGLHQHRGRGTIAG
jgi:hypothetical protein